MYLSPRDPAKGRQPHINFRHTSIHVCGAEVSCCRGYDCVAWNKWSLNLYVIPSFIVHVFEYDIQRPVSEYKNTPTTKCPGLNSLRFDSGHKGLIRPLCPLSLQSIREHRGWRVRDQHVRERKTINAPRLM